MIVEDHLGRKFRLIEEQDGTRCVLIREKTTPEKENESREKENQKKRTAIYDKFWNDKFNRKSGNCTLIG